jgi:hypothetical protein
MMMTKYGDNQYVIVEIEDLARELNSRCCFNHLIGLPVKHRIKHPMYDYERRIYDELMKPAPGNADDIVTRSSCMQDSTQR